MDAWHHTCGCTTAVFHLCSHCRRGCSWMCSAALLLVSSMCAPECVSPTSPVCTCTYTKKVIGASAEQSVHICEVHLVVSLDRHRNSPKLSLQCNWVRSPACVPARAENFGERVLNDSMTAALLQLQALDTLSRIWKRQAAGCEVKSQTLNAAMASESQQAMQCNGLQRYSPTCRPPLSETVSSNCTQILLL